MKMDSMRKLYEEGLKDLHSVERQIIEALPRMIKAATNDELKQALEEHLAVTEAQLARLDEIFADLGKSGKGKRCKGMEGILEEGKELLQEDAEPEILDAGILAAAQHVEHYEIAAYGTARQLADDCGFDAIKDLMDQTLDEESHADKLLTKIATGGMFKSGINQEVAT